jgi:drug/metabolite transporter (DMT)-like permease
MAWTSLFTACFIGSAGVVEQVPWLPSTIESWVYLFLLALIVQSLGWWAIAGVLPRVQVSQGSLIILLQPVLATVWGVILFSEYLSPVQIIGAVITLSAVYYGSTLGKSFKRSPKRAAP